MSQTEKPHSGGTQEQGPKAKVMSHRAAVIEHMGWAKSGDAPQPQRAAEGIAALCGIIVQKEVKRLKAEGKIA